MADQFLGSKRGWACSSYKLNNEAVFNADDTEDIKTIDTSTAPDGLKYLDRTYKIFILMILEALYWMMKNYVIEANAGGGRF